MKLPPALSPDQVEIALNMIASRKSPDEIEAANGMPAHVVVAALQSNDVHRRAYAAALEVAAQRNDEEAHILLDQCMTAPKGQRFILRSKAQALRCSARDSRKLATQLAKRQLPDQAGSIEIRSTKMLKELARQGAGQATPSTTDNQTTMERMVHRHLAKLNAQATVKSPAAAPSPIEPISLGDILHLDAAEFTALVKSTVADRRRYDAASPATRSAFLSRARRMGLIAPGTAPASTSKPAGKLVGFDDATLDALMKSTKTAAPALQS